jgi:hypothetical protein
MNTYIQRVLESNSLHNEVEMLRNSGESCVHIDRHVELPKPHESRDVAQITCLAGIRLLMQWRTEREELLSSGVQISAPVLVLDDEWMNQLTDAPPPHVCITIAKEAKSFAPPQFVDHGGDDFDGFSLKGMIEQEAGRRTVVRVSANPNPPYEEMGFWLVM